jgi:ABC-2 type transport system permease protein
MSGMTRGVRALVKKELLEVTGDPYSRRGGFIQAGVLVLVLGVLMPMSATAAWRAGSPQAIVFFALVPGVAAATLAADAFAGERERRTLETLLATPLAEWTILTGKLIAAVLWALLVASVAFVAATVVVSLSGGGFMPAPIMVLGALGAAAASGSVMASIAIVVSMVIPAARPAQQVASIGSWVLIGSGLAAWRSMGLALAWNNVLLAEASAFLVALVVITIAHALFQRPRFFRG